MRQLCEEVNRGGLEADTMKTMPALLALFGPKQGLRIPLTGRLVLGRGPAADLQLVDGKVSREHCRIDASGHRVTVEDLGSHNGTYVNGELIKRPTPISEGDEIALGDTLLLLEDPWAGGATEAGSAADARSGGRGRRPLPRALAAALLLALSAAALAAAGS